MKKCITYCVFLWIVFASCEKEPTFTPNETISETPIFKVEGKLGEQTINLVAGENGVLQEPFSTVVNGVDLFAGKIGNGEQSIELAFVNGSIGLPQNFNHFFNQDINFTLTEFSWFQATKDNQPNAPKIDDILFTFQNLQILNSVQIVSSGIFDLCTTIFFVDGTSKTICNNLMLGHKDYGAYNVNFTTTPNTNVVAKIIGNASPISQVEWYIDNQFISTTETLQVPPGLGPVVVKSVVRFENGITRTHEVIVDSDGEGRYFGDIHQYINAADQNLMSDYGFVAEFNLNGNYYTSYANVDNRGGFEVQSFKFFKKLPNGKSIYRVDGIIDGSVLDLQFGNTLPLHLNVTFAVEMPF